MTAKKLKAKDHVEYHKDGSIWAKGKSIDGVPEGYWEWFRKDGTQLRSGYFKNGVQVGEWTTYDRSGDPYKVTTMKSKGKKQRGAVAEQSLVPNNSVEVPRTTSKM